MNGIRQYMNRYEQKETARRMSHHIVIVEDEPVTQARLQAYFEQEGYRVSVTDSGAGLRVTSWSMSTFR